MVPTAGVPGAAAPAIAGAADGAPGVDAEPGVATEDRGRSRVVAVTRLPPVMRLPVFGEAGCAGAAALPAVAGVVGPALRGDAGVAAALPCGAFVPAAVPGAAVTGEGAPAAVDGVAAVGTVAPGTGTHGIVVGTFAGTAPGWLVPAAPLPVSVPPADCGGRVDGWAGCVAGCAGVGCAVVVGWPDGAAVFCALAAGPQSTAISAAPVAPKVSVFLILSTRSQRSVSGSGQGACGVPAGGTRVPSLRIASPNRPYPARSVNIDRQRETQHWQPCLVVLMIY